TNPRQHLRAPFVLVTGGKGGVGKTTVCANLGVQLAGQGHSVLVVDLDLGLSNLGLFLGVQAQHTIEDALAHRCTFADCVKEGPDGVHFLAAANGSESLANLGADARQRLIAGIAELSSQYDVVLGDSAAGVGSDVLHFASIADRVLVVTTPEVAALTDAYGLIKAIDEYGTRSKVDIPTPELVVNQCSGVEEGQDIARKLRQVCERFLARTPRQAGWIPRSRNVAQAAQRSTPFVGPKRRGLEQLCLRQIAARFRVLVGRGAPAGAL
ncbi:MAG: AAA family ATPase, partial [Planctomycetes bacterium]|nr:AAA family ATPase [Planctomycetota bacterium]